MKTLILSDEQLLIIDRGLQELPFKIAAPVFHEINKQLKEQADKNDVTNLSFNELTK